MTLNLSNYTQIDRNLWKSESTGKYFRLFAQGVTPNGCWLVNARLLELSDIDISTGNDVYGAEIIEAECPCGTVQAGPEYRPL